MSWDWSKEDSDIVAVIDSLHGRDVLLKKDLPSGQRLVKRRSDAEWEVTNLWVDYYLKEYPNLCHIRPEQPEWSVYNNDKPFGELSDEQKGKLMVASLSCDIQFHNEHFCVWSLCKNPSWSNEGVYRAKQPEPSMVDKFIADVPAGLDWREVELAALHMINEGWVKS